MRSVNFFRVTIIALAVFLLGGGGTALADSFFDAPSTGNNYEFTIRNGCVPYIHDLKINMLLLVYDPALIVTNPVFTVEDNSPRFIGPYDETKFKINNIAPHKNLCTENI